MIIKIIDKSKEDDINIINEKFEITGRFIPKLENNSWTYSIEKFDRIEYDIFPDENYNYDSMRKDHILFGAYDKGKCIGLAILKVNCMYKYIYLHDLKVNKKYRKKKKGIKLIDEYYNYSKQNNKLGIYTIAQSNNLNACLFYLKNGFII